MTGTATIPAMFDDPVGMSELPSTADIMAAEDRWQLATYAKLPMVLVEGKGCHVRDRDGNEYLDLYGGHCVALVGHCHPRLVEALQRQAGRLLFYSNAVYNDVRAVAAERLCALAPEGLRRVFFCNSGTEANETALKIARRATGRRRVISMTDGFHGRTLGSLGVTGPDKYRDPSWPVSTEHDRIPFGDTAALRRILSGDLGRRVAAIIVEPIPSMGGIRVADASWYHALRYAADACGALLIFDEVQTGFGRTGTNFFGDQVDVRPDLITGAKGVAGGVPAGVVFVREDIAADVGPGEQGTTFGGGPLAAAAMAEVAAILVDEGLPARAAEVGAALSEALARVPGVVSVGGMGLLLGINLDRPAKPVVTALRERGVLTGGSGDPNQIRLLPPLTLTREQALPFVDTLASLLASDGEMLA